MTLWGAIQGLRDNPLFRLEQRRQWRGFRVPLLVLGAVGVLCGCTYWAAFLLAPAFAAMAIAHDKRARIWHDILLTRLSAEEIVVAKLVPSLVIPGILLLIGIVVHLGWYAVVFLWAGAAGGRGPFSLEALGGWGAVSVSLLLGVATAAVIQVAGGLAGICAALYHDQGANAVVLACGVTVLLEAVATFAAVRFMGELPSLMPVPWTGVGGWEFGLVPAAVLGFLVVAGINGLAAAGLWRLSTRAVRG